MQQGKMYQLWNKACAVQPQVKYIGSCLTGKQADDLLGKASLKKSYLLPEFAFLGRSNVGKSSLLNAICETNIAKVSKTPGRTQMVNYMYWKDTAFLLDMPGYGFAKAPSELVNTWQTSMVEFLKDRTFVHPDKPLRMCYVLIDSRHLILDADALMLRMVHKERLPYAIVLTKMDQLNQEEQSQVYGAMQEQMQYYFPMMRDPLIIPTSTRQKLHINVVQNHILSIANECHKIEAQHRMVQKPIIQQPQQQQPVLQQATQASFKQPQHKRVVLSKQDARNRYVSRSKML